MDAFRYTVNVNHNGYVGRFLKHSCLDLTPFVLETDKRNITSRHFTQCSDNSFLLVLWHVNKVAGLVFNFISVEFCDLKSRVIQCFLDRAESSDHVLSLFHSLKSLFRLLQLLLCLVKLLTIKSSKVIPVRVQHVLNFRVTVSRSNNLTLGGSLCSGGACLGPLGFWFHGSISNSLVFSAGFFFRLVIEFLVSRHSGFRFFSGHATNLVFLHVLRSGGDLFWNDTAHLFEQCQGSLL